MRKDLKLFYCEKLRCKLTPNGCRKMQKRARLQKMLDSGIVNEKTIKFLFDPLPYVPCLNCKNPISNLN